MNFIKRLWTYWRLFRKQFEQSVIMSVEAEVFLKQKFKDLKYLECLDGYYMACDKETSKIAVSCVPVHKQKYVTEEHDCENFAYEFYALIKRGFPRIPVGVCHVIRSDGSKHALNFILYKTKGGNISFSFIEPQTLKMSYYNYKPYFMVM